MVRPSLKNASIDAIIELKMLPIFIQVYQKQDTSYRLHSLVWHGPMAPRRWAAVIERVTGRCGQSGSSGGGASRLA